MPQRSNSARYIWGDRNPVQKSLSYLAAGVVPHATTTRATYTTPTGKKAQIQNASLAVRVDSVAAPAGRRETYVDITQGATTSRVLYSMLGADKNVVGNIDKSSVGLGGQLLSGDVIKIDTYDDSTGGTMGYLSSCLLTEYDI